MHRQNRDAFETAIALQISFGKPVVVSPGRSARIVPVDDAADALARRGEENGIIEADLIHEIEPSFGSGVLKPSIGVVAKAPGGVRVNEY